MWIDKSLHLGNIKVLILCLVGKMNDTSLNKQVNNKVVAGGGGGVV